MAPCLIMSENRVFDVGLFFYGVWIGLLVRVYMYLMWDFIFLTLFALITINVLVRMCCGDLAGFEVLCFRCFVKCIFMFRLSYLTLFHSGVLGDFAELPV